MTRLTSNITRIVYRVEDKEPATIDSILVSKSFSPESHVKPNWECDLEGNLNFLDESGKVILREVGHELIEKDVYECMIDGKPIIETKQTANGEVNYVANARREVTGTAYEGKLTFEIGEEEALYGLGQHEDGIYDYHGKKEYLYQHNMKISIPFILSSKNYGILIDTETAMIFEGSERTMSFILDTTHELAYYVITGQDFDEIMASLRELTGNAVMLPRWAFGYIQSKERYETSDELIKTAKEFKTRDIPLDCLVQDWLTWRENLWGEKKVDKKRYPDLKGLISTLHNENVHLVASVWPYMAEGGDNYQEFKEADLLLPNSLVYDAFNEEARKLYWKQCNEEWFSSGVDAWWCDSTEPFSDPDWNGPSKREEEVRYNLIIEESKKSIDWCRLNTYGLLHAKGIYENWRHTTEEKRVTNLTRSTYIGGQQYGVICWSGDISAKWSVLRKQVTEGIKYTMSGLPYWSVDIGGFFTVKDKWENRGCNSSGNPNPLWFWNGDYNDGVNDLGYRELYVRWLQYGTFLPVFRSHGTDTPREPWRFGNPGEPFYDTILKFIKLRYRLMPYIYGLAAEVVYQKGTMLRSLMFDFAKDEKVKTISDSFMLGKGLLVCPVTEPMYYDVNSTPINDKPREREVYLPKGTKWYDFWTNELFEGGQHISYQTPLELIPVFAKAGSIIPFSEPMMYADEKKGEIAEIAIYTGADGSFTLYNDEGDNYSYEKGNYSAILVSYCEATKTIQFEEAKGNYPYQKHFKIKVISNESTSQIIETDYYGKELVINL